MTAGARRLYRLGAVLAVVVVWGTVTTRAEPPLGVYYGNLHAHTEASDGIGTPGEGVGTYRVRSGDTIAFDLHAWTAEGPMARSCTKKKTD